MDKRLSLHRCGGGISDKPTFASSLLDSVYRSIDESERDIRLSIKHDTRVLVPRYPSTFTCRNQITATQPEKQKNVAVSENVILWHHGYTYTTTSPTENSSYGGFSYSETETVFFPKIGTTAPPTWSGTLPEKKKSKIGSIRRKLRELGQTRTPVSPGTRMVNFLNSLMTTSVRKLSKNTEKLVSTPASRSYLTKTGSLRERPLPASGLKRSVRFDPVSDWCYCGGSRTMTMKLRVIRARIFFELENLNAGTKAGGYSDEHPVFETTDLGALRAPLLRFRSDQHTC